MLDGSPEVELFEFLLGVVVDESSGTFLGESLGGWVVGNS